MGTAREKFGHEWSRCLRANSVLMFHPPLLTTQQGLYVTLHHVSPINVTSVLRGMYYDPILWMRRLRSRGIKYAWGYAEPMSGRAGSQSLNVCPEVHTSKGIGFHRFCFFFKVFIEFVMILLLFYGLAFWPQGMWDLNSPTTDPRSKSLDSSPDALSPVMWLRPHLTQVWTHQAVSKLEDCACSSSLSTVSSSSTSSQGHPLQEDFYGPPRLCSPHHGLP